LKQPDAGATSCLVQRGVFAGNGIRPRVAERISFDEGYPGFDVIAWHGIFAPAKTPPAIIKKLNAEFVKALKDPETKELLEKQAMQTVGNSPEQFIAFIKQDIAIWKDVATQAKVEVK
jgi:tripartite-type tricarboxylate transporter receptor subunit TctC